MDEIDTKIDREIRSLFERERRLSAQSDAAFVAKTISAIESSDSLGLFFQFFAPIILSVFVIAAGLLLPTSVEIMKTEMAEISTGSWFEVTAEPYYLLIVAAFFFWAFDQRKYFI
ncbi:MAG: hypothetical protein FD163_2088 [Hyphomonadaceae bacterium]|nr:MAG: hypothetical protein FD128_674 [Hyphomonadaceae bacterium]KAF0183894.1 MAG: hypothetical protein FD163_2088 [Hyphomonadaceae bacterium]